MDTKQFFDLVLPSQGLRVLALPTDGKGFRHKFGPTNGWTAQAANRLDRDHGLNVFFGCASYLSDASRKSENVAFVRSFWLDVDAGAGKPYATAKEAAKAVLVFGELAGLPKPYLVASGGGIHVYWPMAEDMTVEQWKRTALILKQVVKDAGLDADPSRTADVASVLRPVGCHHRKRAPKVVRLISSGAVSTLGDFHQALVDYCAANNLAPASTPKPRAALNDDLSAGLEYPPAWTQPIVDNCGVVRLLRDTQGNLDQPTWYNVLGVLAFCEDGDGFAHEWSSGYKGYSAAETDAKLDQQRQFRPTTCAKLADTQDAVCQACPHFGKITSPITFGLREQPAIPIYHVTDDEVEETTGLASTKIELPAGFRWQRAPYGPSHDALCSSTEDADGNVVWHPFCETLFYPTGRLDYGDHMVLDMHVQVKPGEIRTFKLKTQTIGEGGKSLLSELGAHEIMAIPKMKPHLESYLSRWVDKLKSEADAAKVYNHFGWVGKDFLVGTTMLTATGDKPAMVHKVAGDKADLLEPRGHLDNWIKLVNLAYNYPGQEAYQYLILTSFAAPLFAMFGQYGGVTVHAASPGSGKGKTTAQRVGLSVWGNYEGMQLAAGKVTTNMLWGLLGAYHNLPVLLDELTNERNDLASDLVYSMSSGRQKERMTATGELNTNLANWSTILMTNGNNLLSEKLGMHRANAEAELARLFEFTVDCHSRLNANDANKLFPKFLDNYGHAGRVFMRHVVANYDTVLATMIKMQDAFNVEARIGHSERYWSALNAAVLTALLICRKLDLLGFDANALKSWILARLADNRQQMTVQVSDPLEQFGKMLADVGQGILVTLGEGNLRTKAVAEIVQPEPKGALVGRCVIASDTKENTRLFLNSVAVREWCNKRGVSAQEMFDAAVAAGWAEPDQVRYVLGKGTLKYSSITSQVRCWVIDPLRMGAEQLGDGTALKMQLVNAGVVNDGVAHGSQRNPD